jgi:hypothetical protein
MLSNPNQAESLFQEVLASLQKPPSYMDRNIQQIVKIYGCVTVERSGEDAGQRLLEGRSGSEHSVLCYD